MAQPVYSRTAPINMPTNIGSMIVVHLLLFFQHGGVASATDFSSARRFGRPFGGNCLHRLVEQVPRGGNSRNAEMIGTINSQMIDQSISQKIGNLDAVAADKDIVASSTTPKEKNDANDADDGVHKKARKRFFFFGGANGKNNTETQPSPPKEERKSNKSQKKRQKKRKDGQEKSKKSDKSNSNPSSKPEKDPSPPPKGEENSKPTVIVLGGSPSQQQQQQYRMLQASTQHGMMRPPTAAESKSAIITDLLATLIRLGTRIWMILWIKAMATEHETIKPVQHFVWERLNDRYTEDAQILNAALEEPPHGIRMFRWRREHNWRVLQRARTAQLPLKETFNRTVVVVQVPIDGGGNVNLSYLSDVVSFLIQQYRSRAFGTRKDKKEKAGLPMPLEVLLLIKSGGGAVSKYGLAAAQVQRLAKEEGISLTVSVDQAAASGGYMVASQAHHLIAAPFAALGSVGVMMEGFNVREALRNYGVAPISLKAGKYKNTLSMFGPVTAADEKHEVDRLKKVHESFRELVVASRPMLADSMNILEGQVFLGSEALKLGLVDNIQTSDEYIMERIEAGDRVLKLHQSKMHLSRRRVQLSPLDILPHLRNWVSDRISSANPELVASWALSLSTIWGFASHLYQQYVAANDSD